MHHPCRPKTNCRKVEHAIISYIIFIKYGTNINQYIMNANVGVGGGGGSLTILTLASHYALSLSFKDKPPKG